MYGIARTVMLTPDQDRYLAQVMAARGWSRSHIVRLALDKLRAEPALLFLADLVPHERSA